MFQQFQGNKRVALFYLKHILRLYVWENRLVTNKTTWFNLISFNSDTVKNKIDNSNIEDYMLSE
jgi:hypothetical protein